MQDLDIDKPLPVATIKEAMLGIIGDLKKFLRAAETKDEQLFLLNLIGLAAGIHQVCGHLDEKETAVTAAKPNAPGSATGTSN